MDLVDRVEPEHYPPILLLYPVLREAEATMRTTFLGLAEIDYPRERYRVIAVPNHDDRATIDSLTRLADEFDFVEVMTVPPTTDESWDVVWEAWDANPKAYWWHLGRGADARHHPDRKRRCDLPPKKTRQLVYAFYNLVAEHGEEGWLLNYIDADSVPPKDHFLAAVAGMQEYDVLQSTNIAGHLLATWPSSWHSFDHMSWDGLIYPHMSANGKHPYWVLGKGLFMRASDVVGVGGFNPWLTIEDPDVGMRLWKAGKRLGVIANPLIEEVPITVRDGITQRKRWIAGFFQSLAAPLRHMGMTGWERFKARLNLVPSLSLIINPIGLPVGVVVMTRTINGTLDLPVALTVIGVVNTVCFIALLTYIYVRTWRRSGLVLETWISRARYWFRINPIFLWVYWTIWTVPVTIGFQMFLRNRRQAWERTNKNDANHDLVRGILGQTKTRSTSPDAA
jgi:cellulose synthase/poly-beta-1,6-N-acetylglucosamine synthase-like glycosyltransferase